MTPMHKPPMISLGRYIPSPSVTHNNEAGNNETGDAEGGLRILSDAPELERHVTRPWLRAWAAERLDIPLTSLDKGGSLAGPAQVGTQAKAGFDQLARHACVCGATGSGKTRLALHLLSEQLKAGCSVVLLDPKAETVRHLLMLAHAAGIEPGQVTVLSPFLAGTGAPGWNPMDTEATGITPAQAASDVVAVLASSTSSWGPRMQDLLTNALIVIASHGLSLFELARFLQREDYRDALLHLPLPVPQGKNSQGKNGQGKNNEQGNKDQWKSDDVMLEDVAFQEARDYFLSEFAAWGKSERAAATAPVLNKFRELLRSPFLRSLLCARRNTLHLGSLWHKPGLVLVHLDAAALGDEGVRMLGGLLAHQLLRTAMRADGPVPVVLALDEMGVSEEFVGGAAAKILAIARSRGLRLLVACQHLAQLSDGLRSALLANTAVQAFFRLGYADARLVAASLAAGTGERVAKVAADVARRDVARRDVDGEPEAWAEAKHTVRDGYGEPVALSPAAAQAFWHLTQKGTGAAQVNGLVRLARVSGIDRLYVHAADTKAPVELLRYLRGLDPNDYFLEGEKPLRLVVTFPRPRLSVLSRETEGERERRWIRTLTGLAVQQAVLRLSPGGSDLQASTPAGVVQVVSVSDPGSAPGFERFVSAAVAGSGQPAREVAQAQEWRREQVEKIAYGKIAHGADMEAVEQAMAERASHEPMPNGGSMINKEPMLHDAGAIPPGNKTRTASRSPRKTAQRPGPARRRRDDGRNVVPVPSERALGAAISDNLPKRTSEPILVPGTIAEDGSLA